MSGIVSYDLFNSKFGNCGFTPEGGIYTTFINNTGTSVKGTIVVASSTVNGGVDIAPANSQISIGVIYESGIDNGASVKVVINGKAQVLLKDGQSSTTGYWCGVSDVAGRMYQRNIVPGGASEHNQQIGSSIETKTSGTNVLAKVQLYFN